MSKKTKSIIWTIGIILLGFVREYLFVNINWIYLTLVNGRMNGARREFHFLLDWSPSQINQLKMCLSVLFILGFFLITRLIIKIYFENKAFNRITLILFGSIIIIALVLFGFGKITGLYNSLYGAIHNLILMVQSFMPLMILFVLFKFFKAEKSPSD